uniref:Uncharacterized protein n=1 Tax=Heliothis virescens TaxID=7102 RepID=A0A2A4JXE2_HELVI
MYPSNILLIGIERSNKWLDSEVCAGHTKPRLVRIEGTSFSKASAQRSAALAALSIFRSLWRGEARGEGGGDLSWASPSPCKHKHRLRPPASQDRHPPR